MHGSFKSRNDDVSLTFKMSWRTLPYDKLESGQSISQLGSAHVCSMSKDMSG
jgi:hypothetical protein